MVDAAGLIVAVCPASDIPIQAIQLTFPGELWTAAPVMAHAHLESFDAPSSSWRGVGFSAWVKQLLAWRQSPARLPAAASAAMSLAELQRFGCGLVATHVSEMGADGSDCPTELPEVLPLTEIFAPDVDDLDSPLIKEARQGKAVALHAPFSIAEDVAKAVFSAADGGLVSIHLGEHVEEREYLASGSGPLAELLQARGRGLKSQHWSSPVEWLNFVEGLRPGTLVVHGGDLGIDELKRLDAAGVGLVFCPGTHEFFARPRPAFLEAGIQLPALGCDSRASNERLDPLRELRVAYEMMPQAGAQAWWHALTSRGAEVLQQPRWGSLSPGKKATFLRLELDGLSPPELEANTVCTALCGDWRPQLQLGSHRSLCI